MRRPAIRIALLALLGLALTGCGQSGTSAEHFKTYYGIRLDNLPKHKVYNMNWIEVAPGTMIIQVKRIEIGPHGWSATVGFRNISKQQIILPIGGQHSPIDFGIGVFISSLSPRIEDPGNYIVDAKAVIPRLPVSLAPGKAWNGIFSSPDPPRSFRYIRVVFGVFFRAAPIPKGTAPYFLWVTTHGVRRPAPQGTAAASTFTSTRAN